MGCWFEVEDEVARLKVSQALRYTRRATHSFSATGSGGEDQESVTSRSSQADEADAESESVVPAKVASSSSSPPSSSSSSSALVAKLDANRASSIKDMRPSDHSGGLLIDYDNGSALDPIGPDFEW